MIVNGNSAERMGIHLTIGRNDGRVCTIDGTIRNMAELITVIMKLTIMALIVVVDTSGLMILSIVSIIMVIICVIGGSS